MPCWPRCRVAARRGAGAMRISTRAWLVGKPRFAIIRQSTIYYGNILLVFNCRYKLRAGPRDPPPELPAGAGHVQRPIIIGWAAGAAGARHEFAGPDPGQAPADVQAAAPRTPSLTTTSRSDPYAGLTEG